MTEATLEMTIQVPEQLAEQVATVRDRLPEILAYGLQQLPPVPTEVYRYVFEFLSGQPSAEEILNFAPTTAMQARVQVLLEKNRQGALSELEVRELDEYVRINHFITLIKAQTLPYLAPQN
jgi:hypothetical protein